MGFPNVASLADAMETTGANWLSFFHKTGSPALPAAGWSADLSMAAGTPRYNAYVGTQAEGTPIVGSGNNGIYAPGVNAGQTLHVVEAAIGVPSATFAPATFWLCDYLYAYPLMDLDSTDFQAMDNGVAPVPRYADGVGVNIMVVTTTPQTAVAQMNLTYTNEAGATGRTSTIWTGVSNVGNIQGAQAASGAAGSMGPFVPLASGDRGVQAVEGIQMLASGGGFAAVVLVRPLLKLHVRENATVAEVSYLINDRTLPRVLPGAYLNWVYTSGVAAVSSVVRGHVRFAWR